MIHNGLLPMGIINGECVSLAKQHNFKTTKSTEWMDELLDAMGQGEKSLFIRSAITEYAVALGLVSREVTKPKFQASLDLVEGGVLRKKDISVSEVPPKKDKSETEVTQKEDKGNTKVVHEEDNSVPEVTPEELDEPPMLIATEVTEDDNGPDLDKALDNFTFRL
ncbi:hypothetical protein Goe2_c13200 [Bacillus phage vB_BsuM-Goe2]|uniref:Uncharacterized protein n=1 Tax=Bacillus phage vB_BsuM-Goe2 TaxID=1933062 RepID=A0A217EQP5_9CAUD|nr:hypothetical protein Goe2_c13200 [Bacillus phage vB_BsuM-Goe2]